MLPELLDEVLSLLDDVDSGLQGGLLLLAEALDQLLHRLHRLSIHIIQKLLLQLLQPRPQLRKTDSNTQPITEGRASTSGFRGREVEREGQDLVWPSERGGVPSSLMFITHTHSHTLTHTCTRIHTHTHNDFKYSIH